MKEKILAFLKTKLAGVQETYLKEVADFYAKSLTDETKIEATFTDGVVDFIKLNASQLQKEGDRRATEASATAVKTFQEKHGLDENGKTKAIPGKTDPAPNPDEPAWFTAFKKEQAEKQAELNAKIEKQEKEKTSSVLTEKVKAHPKLKDIPASFLAGRNLTPASEADIDNLVNTIETEYNGLKQELVEKGVIQSQPPKGGGAPVDGKVGDDVNDYLEEKFPKAEGQTKT
jgi:hypothetical protein